MDAFIIDAVEFCRLKERREGVVLVKDLPRLAQEAADQSGEVRWSLEGGRNHLGHPQLIVAVSGTVSLICQRCLEPFPFEMESDSTLVLAPDEAAADEIDGLLVDEDVEVIVATHALDVAAIIEDDALLSLPVSPRHATCPVEPLADKFLKDEKVSPFDILKKLKQ